MFDLAPATLDHYKQLAHHHYRAARPATATRVLALFDTRPTPADRFWSRSAEPRPVAVLVESLPSLSCRLRDHALHDRYACLAPRPRGRLLNRELRTLSRVVVDPRFRGQGLAVRLVRHALNTATTRFTEALAAMGRVNPFFEKAGMTAYRRAPLTHDARLFDALDAAGFSPRDLAHPPHLLERIEQALPADRHLLLAELARWHRHAAGRPAHLRSEDPLIHLRAAQKQLALEPVYYIHINHGVS